MRWLTPLDQREKCGRKTTSCHGGQIVRSRRRTPRARHAAARRWLHTLHHYGIDDTRRRRERIDGKGTSLWAPILSNGLCPIAINRCRKYRTSKSPSNSSTTSSKSAMNSSVLLLLGLPIFDVSNFSDPLSLNCLCHFKMVLREKTPSNEAPRACSTINNPRHFCTV